MTWAESIHARVCMIIGGAGRSEGDFGGMGGDLGEVGVTIRGTER